MVRNWTCPAWSESDNRHRDVMAEFTTCRAAYLSRRLLLLCNGECRHWFDFPAYGMSRERVNKQTASRVLEASRQGSGEGGGRQPAASAIDRGGEEAVDGGAGQDHGAARRHRGEDRAVGGRRGPKTGVHDDQRCIDPAIQRVDARPAALSV